MIYDMIVVHYFICYQVYMTETTGLDAKEMKISLEIFSFMQKHKKDI